MNSFEIKDSGQREEFSSGAVRDTADDKSRPDLISPFFLHRLGFHLARGAKKYSEWNWAKGIPSSRCAASLHRHLNAWERGETDEDHLAAAAFNLMAIIHNEEVCGKDVYLSVTDSLHDMPRFKK